MLKDQHDDGYISSDEDEEAAKKWNPAPLTTEQGYGLISKKYAVSDTISSLVNIFGSEREFLEEY